jgi:hypothetical protein
MKKPRLRGERAGCLRISRRTCYGPGLIGYQTGACIVRQTQDQTGPEYIRPGTVTSKLGDDARRSEVHMMSAGVSLIWGLKLDPQGAT